MRKFKVQKKLPIILEQKEIRKLLEQPKENKLIGLRNLAIMKTMLNCGLRVSEITNLKILDIDLENGKLKVIQGKGRKDRNLALNENVKSILTKWNKKRPQGLYFFPTFHGEKLSSRYLQQMIKRYALSAGINKAISPHTLRHIYATEFYRLTKDIETLRQILGHSNISTTTIYITLANSEVEAGMKAFPGF